MGPCPQMKRSIQLGVKTLKNFSTLPSNSRTARSANSPGVCNCLCSHSSFNHLVLKSVMTGCRCLFCLTAYILQSASRSFHVFKSFGLFLVFLHARFFSLCQNLAQMKPDFQRKLKQTHNFRLKQFCWSLVTADSKMGRSEKQLNVAASKRIGMLEGFQALPARPFHMNCMKMKVAVKIFSLLGCYTDYKIFCLLECYTDYKIFCLLGCYTDYKIFSLLGCYTDYICSKLPKFGDKLLGAFSKLKQSNNNA